MIDTYNQFPEAYQVAVVVVCGHLSNRIFHMLWMVIVAFAIKKLQTRVMYSQEIYREKLWQPTVIKAAISSNGPTKRLTKWLGRLPHCYESGAGELCGCSRSMTVSPLPLYVQLQQPLVPFAHVS
jgi:hypothetical protein